MRRRRVHLLKVLSVMFTPGLLVGCIYIPAPDSPAHKGDPNPHQLIGPPTTNKPIRPGVVTRNQVIERLGPPVWQDPEAK